VLPEAVMPDTLWVSMYFFITEALLAAAAGYALQNEARPT
jgi:hypothetical protein